MLLASVAMAAALHLQLFPGAQVPAPDRPGIPVNLGSAGRMAAGPPALLLARSTTAANDPFMAPASPFAGPSSVRLPDDPVQEARMPRVSAHQLHALMLRHQGVVVVDARDAYSYEASHIPGAIDFPLLQFGRQYRLLPKDRLIALYCT